MSGAGTISPNSATPGSSATNRGMLLGRMKELHLV